jgi:hypothetical protein
MRLFDPGRGGIYFSLDAFTTLEALESERTNLEADKFDLRL